LVVSWNPPDSQREHKLVVPDLQSYVSGRLTSDDCDDCDRWPSYRIDGFIRIRPGWPCDRTVHIRHSVMVPRSEHVMSSSRSPFGSITTVSFFSVGALFCTVIRLANIVGVNKRGHVRLDHESAVVAFVAFDNGRRLGELRPESGTSPVALYHSIRSGGRLGLNRSPCHVWW